MRCKKCGKELKENARFCGYCGAPVQPEKQKKATGKKKMLVMGCTVFAVLILGIFAGKVFLDNSSGSSIPGIKKVSEDENCIAYPDGDVVYQPQGENVDWDEKEKVLYYNNLISVYLMEKLSEKEENQIAEQIDGEVVTRIHGAVQFIQIKIKPATYAEINQYIDKLNENEKVMDALYDAPNFVKTDELDENPWSSDGKMIDGRNTMPPAGNDWWAEAVDAYDVWKYVDKNKDDLSKITVGILDNGFDVNHEDLVNAEGSEKITALEGYETNSAENHGTHVMGLIGANNNKIGIRGIADLADIKYADWSPDTDDVEFDVSLLGTGEYIHIIQKIIQNECVINNSFGYSSYFLSESKYMMEQLQEVFKNLKIWNGNTTWKYQKTYRDYKESYIVECKQQAEVCMDMVLNAYLMGYDKYLIVQSAGNGNSLNEPCDATMNGFFSSISKSFFDTVMLSKSKIFKEKYTYEKLKEHILIVGAVENQDKDGKYKLASYSNYGDNVDICAPGGGTTTGSQVYSTVVPEKNQNVAYGEIAGTSMAAPIVSGSAAVLWQIEPDLTAAEVKKMLTETAGQAYPTAKDDTRESYPMLNAGAAVKKLVAEKKGATSVKYKLDQEETEYNGEETVGEYATVTGYDDLDQVIWEFQSEVVPMTEMPTVYEIGIHGDNYYLEIGNTLYAFTVSKGEKVWSLELDGSISAHVFDQDDNLYFCCYYGPDFCQVNSEGKLIKQISTFYRDPDGLYWPSAIQYDKNKVIISMDGTPSGETETVTVNLKDYSYTRSDADFIEKKEKAENAKYKLLKEVWKKHKGEETAPAYCEFDLSGDKISEIIIRTYTDQATEGGRYMYQIYHYDDKVESYVGGQDEFSSYCSADAVHYYLDGEKTKIIVDWTFADELSFVVYTYDDLQLTEEEVTDDMSDSPVVEFMDIQKVDWEIYDKKEKEKPADSGKKYDVEEFIGYYCQGVDEELLDEYPNMNPEVIELYYNEDGTLESYRGYRFGTTGTSYYYPYDSYTIEGNTLICKYSTVRSYMDETSENGEHRFQLTNNKNLIVDQNVWFRHDVS